MKHRGPKRRKEILAFIRAYRAQNGMSPSVGDIAEGLGTQKSNIHHHLGVLEEEGLLTRHPGKARSWVPKD